MPVASPPTNAVAEQEIRQPYTAAAQDALFDELTKLAQTAPQLALERVTLLESAPQRDRILKLGFTAAMAQQPDAAKLYLPSVIDRGWLADVSFPDACGLAASIDAESPAMAEKLLLRSALKNPDVALRNAGRFLSLSFGQRLFEQVATAAPDEAMAIAAGTSKQALAMRERMQASQSGEVRLLAELAGDSSLDFPERRRVALLGPRIASGALTLAAALRLAGSNARFFGALVDMRIAGLESADRALESEALTFCRGLQERGAAAELAGFSPRDLYLLLAYGRAEVTDGVFNEVFGRLKARTPGLVALLDQTGNLKLRDFAAAAIGAHRFEAFQQLGGSEAMSRVARGIDQSGDPLREAVTVAEVIDGAGREALHSMAAAIAAEYRRCAEAGNQSAQTLYGLLAAGPGAGLGEIAALYAPYLTKAETFETASLFGKDGLCVQRHFFYDDDDGVESFNSFRSEYARDGAWKVEDRRTYVHITGAGAAGRRIEIFANVPIDSHIPANAARQDQARDAQRDISAALAERGLTASMLVHRGHAFWVERTVEYLTSSAKLVFLGSCGGATEVHAVIERSRDAQVIATRGVGTTAVNDAILKSLSDWLLRGDAVIEWPKFWQAQRAVAGRNAMFRDYFAPDQDTGSMLLRAYYQSLR